MMTESEVRDIAAVDVDALSSSEFHEFWPRVLVVLAEIEDEDQRRRVIAVSRKVIRRMKREKKLLDALAKRNTELARSRRRA